MKGIIKSMVGFVVIWISLYQGVASLQVRDLDTTTNTVVLSVWFEFDFFSLNDV